MARIYSIIAGFVLMVGIVAGVMASQTPEGATAPGRGDDKGSRRGDVARQTLLNSAPFPRTYMFYHSGNECVPTADSADIPRQHLPGQSGATIQAAAAGAISA